MFLASDVRLAYQEGYRSTEHLKRYTTLGMGTDQGKTSGVQGLAVLGRITDQSHQRAGPDDISAALYPYNVGSRGGPVGREPVSSDAPDVAPRLSRGGRGCLRECRRLEAPPLFYTRTSETMNEAVQREALAVRNGVGLFDASIRLGKSSSPGRDAVWLLGDALHESVARFRPPPRPLWGDARRERHDLRRRRHDAPGA